MMHIRELTPPEMPELLYPFILLLNPKLERAEYDASLAAMLSNGYRAAAVFEGDECLGVTGLWVGCKFYCGHYVEIDNFVMKESARGKGIGKAMLDWVESFAASLGARTLMLDAYVTNPQAHKLYFREGYNILGYHFLKKC